MKERPDDDVPEREEMMVMSRLAIEFVRTARALEAYAEAFSGKPEMN